MDEANLVLADVGAELIKSKGIEAASKGNDIDGNPAGAQVLGEGAFFTDANDSRREQSRIESWHDSDDLTFDSASGKPGYKAQDGCRRHG
jgi:hypothetical protein